MSSDDRFKPSYYGAPSGLTIRPWRGGDRQIVKNLIGISMESHWFAAFFAQIPQSPETCTVAELDGQIVASVMYEDNGDTRQIFRLVVRAEYRRRYIARALVAFQMREAIGQLGMRRVLFVVPADDHVMSKLLDWHQFRLADVRPLAYQDEIRSMNFYEASIPVDLYQRMLARR
jgi:ribosomal protein S18 acetylase RimI-like enzyme